jgi:MerR family mercuric resistance operon transcriptional regulator
MKDDKSMRYGWTIGALANRAGCRVETVRYYERAGLMPVPPRTAGGHRSYGRDHVKRLIFVRRARELGFTIDEVRELLALADRGAYTCADVKTATLSHRAGVKRKLADLRRLDRALGDLADRCAGGDGQDCAIFDALFDAGAKRRVGR